MLSILFGIDSMGRQTFILIFILFMECRLIRCEKDAKIHNIYLLLRDRSNIPRMHTALTRRIHSLLTHDSTSLLCSIPSPLFFFFLVKKIIINKHHGTFFFSFFE